MSHFFNTTSNFLNFIFYLFSHSLFSLIETDSTLILSYYARIPASASSKPFGLSPWSMILSIFCRIASLP